MRLLLCNCGQNCLVDVKTWVWRKEGEEVDVFIIKEC